LIIKHGFTQEEAEVGEDGAGFGFDIWAWAIWVLG
jgi:hypothetical protein